jgi:hypothetical protein
MDLGPDKVIFIESEKNQSSLSITLALIGVETHLLQSFFVTNPQLGARITEVNVVDYENNFSYIVKEGSISHNGQVMLLSHRRLNEEERTRVSQP